MKKLRILVDADGVLENFSETWVAYLNKKYGVNVSHDDVHEWDMTKAYPMLTSDQVLSTELDSALYDGLQPIAGGPEAIKRLLDDGHEIYVVTNTHYKIAIEKLEGTLFKYYPFLPWRQYIFTHNKQMIKGDVLVDDGVHNLVGGDYEKILFSAPYNRDFDAAANGMTRVENWDEAYAAIKKFAENA